MKKLNLPTNHFQILYINTLEKNMELKKLSVRYCSSLTFFLFAIIFCKHTELLGLCLQYWINEKKIHPCGYICKLPRWDIQSWWFAFLCVHEIKTAQVRVQIARTKVEKTRIFSFYSPRTTCIVIFIFFIYLIQFILKHSQK